MFRVKGKGAAIPEPKMQSLNWRLAFLITEVHGQIGVVREDKCEGLLVCLPESCQAIIAEVRFCSHFCKERHHCRRFGFPAFLLLQFHLLLPVPGFSQEGIYRWQDERSISLLFSFR